MKYKITFNRFAVLIMYICIIGIFAFCIVTKEYPPTSFIIAWFAFWCVQAAITCKLQIDKRSNKRSEKKHSEFMEAIVPYLNENNASALIEKYIGITPQYKEEEEKPKKKTTTKKKTSTNK